MTTHFTFRDFFVYILTGSVFIICVTVIFIEDVLMWTVDIFSKYSFIQDFSFLIIIFLTPAIYIIGHIVGIFSYYLLQLYCWFNRRTFFKKERPKWKHLILMKFQQVLYRQRVVYAVKKNGKYDDVEKFWISCAKLQVANKYSYAEYWYVLNELFNSLNMVFLISFFISAIAGTWILALIYLFLTVVSFKRAKQYAKHFVHTVYNLTLNLNTE